MAPPSKVNAEQKEFLSSLIDNFLEAQKKNRLDKFWTASYLEWFRRWPIEEDASIKDATKRVSAYGVAIGLKKTVR